MSESAFQHRPLSEVTLAIKDGTHGTHHRFSNGVPFLSAKNISETGAVVWDISDDCISESEYQDLNRSFSLESGDLLLTVVGSIGRRAVYSGERVTFQRSVAYVRPDMAVLNSSFLFHWMGHPTFTADLMRRSNATAQAGLYLGELSKVNVPVVPMNEQRAITRVLDTLDTAIRQTEAIIEKLKQVKQGLLHDLLTRGVDANGELRPGYEQAPQLYKQSPLGWIPKDWTSTQVGRETDIQHGFAFAGNLFSSEPVGPTLLVPGNFYREGGLYFTNQNTKYFAGKYPAHSVLSNGDVLVVMTDLSPMTLILGRTVVLNETFPVLHNQRIGKFIFRKESDWDAYFFAALMSDNRVRLKVIAEATGTTVRHTSPDRIKSCFVARPSLNEQKNITARLLALHERLSAEQEKLGKLQNQKAGLMDDLLTGRVRVTPLLKGAEP